MYIQDLIQWKDFNDDTLSFYRAIGVDMICLDIRSMHKLEGARDLRTGQDSAAFFGNAKSKVESHGMELRSVFMAGWEEITLEKPDRDEKIEAWSRMLRCIGAVGITAIGYNFKPMGNFRTHATIGRGGTKYSTFDYSEFLQNKLRMQNPQVSEGEMRGRLEYFLKRVIPVAEESGVRMALHPDDPPIPEPLGGVAQICSTLDHFRQIFDLVSSDFNAMLFCQGCMTELLGADGVYDAIVEMVSREKIVFVHFRNVRGALPNFQEVFLDEGDVDMHKAMEIYRDAGFNGPFMMDHTPSFLNNKADWAGRAYAVGYIRALIQTVYK